MQYTTKFLASCALLASTALAAVDLQYCHGGAKGVCQDITLATPATTCIPTLNATVGTIDTIVGITPGVKYTVFTGATCTGTASTVFGNGTNTLVAPFLNKVLSISAGIPTTWTPLGCFTDFAGSRTLAAATLINETMTIEKCQTFCDAGAFGFAGVEFGSECYCDFSIQFPSVADNATTCNVPCGGNVNETCGGPSRINLFSSGKPLPTIPATIVSPNGTWAYNGCFT
ncbi:hypothetical protein DXG01_000335 [Tephrocybe rancida]|nr:hypothetical protein DXG01_000335 [Tephrocybe rancida]